MRAAVEGMCCSMLTLPPLLVCCDDIIDDRFRCTSSLLTLEQSGEIAAFLLSKEIDGERHGAGREHV